MAFIAREDSFESCRTKTSCLKTKLILHFRANTPCTSLGAFFFTINQEALEPATIMLRLGHYAHDLHLAWKCYSCLHHYQFSMGNCFKHKHSIRVSNTCSHCQEERIGTRWQVAEVRAGHHLFWRHSFKQAYATHEALFGFSKRKIFKFGKFKMLFWGKQTPYRKRAGRQAFSRRYFCTL